LAVPKEEVIRLRIDEEDKALFMKRAEEEGRSLASWMRFHLLRVAHQNGPVKAKRKAK